ncbi:ead/Ea22-like family protein [Escherichia coli]|uniref:ead/Ea22-like family protein n=1 Tax=Escherichia coli TaxID=562 RepID=UPI0025A56008|nr:ead/Ea22-like family protein [Escherichia coli]
MSELYYHTLRERFSPKPAPKCSVCGEEMSMQRISGSHVVYACSGMEDDGCFKTGRTYADEHYKKSRITVVDDSDPDVIELLDENMEMALTLEKLRVELEAAKQRIAELESNRAALAAEHGIQIAINELLALAPRLDKRAVDALSVAVEHLCKLIKKEAVSEQN